MPISDNDDGLSMGPAYGETHREPHRTPQQRFADIEEGLRWNFGPSADHAESAILAIREATAAMDAQYAARLRETEQAAKLDRQRAIKSEAWAAFLANWVDYHHGSGESDRAWEDYTNNAAAAVAGASPAGE